MKREIQSGDYFLLPFKGKRIDLLVQADAEWNYGHWFVRRFNGCHDASTYTLSSCRRIGHALALKIMGLGPTQPRNRTRS